MITRVVMAGLVTASRLAALCVAQLGQARVACHPRLRCCTAFKMRYPRRAPAWRSPTDGVDVIRASNSYSQW